MDQIITKNMRNYKNDAHNGLNYVLSGLKIPTEI